ncbi:MAG: exostosin family protein [Candidatus Babeliales bacterium]
MIFGNSFEKMTMYTFEKELFTKIPNMTSEQRVYEILSIYPIEKDVNYFATSWGMLFRQKRLNQAKLPKKLNGGFTVCQHIRYREIIPVLRELGINILFAPHAPQRQQYNDIIVLPFPLYPNNGINPAEKKDILYSFIGLESHPTRKKIFALPRRSDVIIKRRSAWHFYLRNEKAILLRWSERREQERKEYQNTLTRSRFSLCPRGTGPSTIRFWESLQAGAIPVLLADAMALPKIEGINWDDCIIRILEKNISSVDHIIRAISSEKEIAMRENCLRAFALSCASDNFVQTIRDYFEKIN